MSSIQDIAHEELKVAYADIVKGRQSFLTAVGMLILIYTLTVNPYLNTSREINDLTKEIASVEKLDAKIGDNLQQLTSANTTAKDQVNGLRNKINKKMIRELSDLQTKAELSQLSAPTKPVDAPLSIFENFLNFFSKKPAEPSSQDVVNAAYEQAQAEWEKNIRPKYLISLKATVDMINLATGGENSAATTSNLKAIATGLEAKRDALKTLDISLDNSVKDKLRKGGADKKAYTQLATLSITTQIKKITEIFSAIDSFIGQIKDVQSQVQAGLEKNKCELIKKLAEEEKQQITLAGVPVNIKTLVGLFPLVGSIILCIPVLRSGLTRREAAYAIKRLQPRIDNGNWNDAPPTDDKIHKWQINRMREPVWCPLVVALVTALCAGAVSYQVAGSLMAPPLSPWMTFISAAFVVGASTGWYVHAIKKLECAARELAARSVALDMSSETSNGTV